MKRSMTRKEAKVPFTFTITENDIERGIAGDCQHCVIAEAVCKVPGVAMAEVHRTVADIWFRNGNWYRYIVPTALQYAIDAYDKKDKRLFKKLAEVGEQTLVVPVGIRTLKEQRKRNSKGNRKLPFRTRSTRRTAPRTAMARSLAQTSDPNIQR